MTAAFLSLSHLINLVRSSPDSLSGGLAADCFDRVLYLFTLARRLDHGSKFSRRFPPPLDVPYRIRKPSGGILCQWGASVEITNGAVGLEHGFVLRV